MTQRILEPGEIQAGAADGAPLGMTVTAFPVPGKVALWTKADSVTYFDDLRMQTP